jgi:hypothetical protein
MSWGPQLRIEMASLPAQVLAVLAAHARVEVRRLCAPVDDRPGVPVERRHRDPLTSRGDLDRGQPRQLGGEQLQRKQVHPAGPAQVAQRVVPGLDRVGGRRQG